MHSSTSDTALGISATGEDYILSHLCFSAGAKQEKMQHSYKDLWEMSRSWPAEQNLKEKGSIPHPQQQIEDKSSHHDRVGDRGLCVLQHLKKRMWENAEK